MDDNLRTCRTCLNQISNTRCLSLDMIDPRTTLKMSEVLNKCIPELDLCATPNSVLCDTCYHTITFIYNFRCKSIESELRIGQYQAKHKLATVNLMQVVQWSELKNSDLATETKELDLNKEISTEANKQNNCRALHKGSEHAVLSIKTEVEDVGVISTSSYEETAKEVVPLIKLELKVQELDLKDELQVEEPRDCDLNFENYLTSSNNESLIEKEHAYAKTSTSSISTTASNISSTPKGNLFECPQCTFSTNKYCNLCSHLQRHAQVKRYKCASCAYQCKNKRTLGIHMRTHTSKKLYKCVHCDYRGNQKDSLRQHLLSHHEQDLFKCYRCKFQSVTKQVLINHLRMHSRLKPFKCSVCGYFSTNKQNIISHMHTHAKPFKCTQCEYHCKYKIVLKIHMKKHTGEK